MSNETGAIPGFGAIILGAINMFVLKLGGVARRKAARCGREVDVGNLIAIGSAAGEGKRTHEQGNHPMHLHAALAFLALVVLDAACVILLLRHAHKRLNLSQDATRDTGFPGSGWS